MVRQAIKREALFSLGQFVGTPGALEVLQEHKVDPLSLLSRHVSGDWGELDEQDAAMNEAALGNNRDRIFSSYKLGDGHQKVWIITEWDRSATTILLPTDY